jgi:hypothetical protein
VALPVLVVAHVPPLGLRCLRDQALQQVTKRASRSLAVMMAVYRVQSVFRGHKARKAAIRKREHDRWVSLNFERSVMRTLVYIVLSICVLFCVFINLIYGVKVRLPPIFVAPSRVAFALIPPCDHHRICSFVFVLFFACGVQFSTAQSNAWIIASLVSFASDALVMEPIILFAKTLLSFGVGIAKTAAEPEVPTGLPDDDIPPAHPDAFREWLKRKEAEPQSTSNVLHMKKLSFKRALRRMSTIQM